MKLLTLLSALAVLSWLPLSAQETEADPFVKTKSTPEKPQDTIQNLVSEIRYIDVDRTTWVEHQAAASPTLDSNALYATVGGWIESGDAALFETALLPGQSGQRAKVQSIREITAPTGFQFESTKTSSVVATPIAFESRDTWLTFELDNVFDSADRILASYAPTLVILDGNSEFPVLGPLPSAPGDVFFPRYRSNSATSQLDATVDHWYLINEGQTISPDGTVDPMAVRLAFLRIAAVITPIDPKAPSHGQGRISFKWVETSRANYTDWTQGESLADLFASTLAQKFFDGLKSGKATLIEKKSLPFISGNRTKVESIKEHLYATEYDPPLSETIDEIPRPTAFETRNVGTTIEIDSVIGSDSPVMNLNSAPEIVTFVGNSVHMRSKIDGELQPSAVMPIFHTMKVTTQINLLPNVRTPLGVLTPPHPETGLPDPTRKVVLFVEFGF